MITGKEGLECIVWKNSTLLNTLCSMLMLGTSKFMATINGSRELKSGIKSRAWEALLCAFLIGISHLRLVNAIDNRGVLATYSLDETIPYHNPTAILKANVRSKCCV